MANGGFNAATDIFGLGAAFKVKTNQMNATGSLAECKDRFGDVTHRDRWGDRIAPTAEYEVADDVTELPALGGVVVIDGKSVAIASIVINTQIGAAPTVTVTGVQVQDGASAIRTYACPGVSVSPRHRAQDITGDLGATTPATLNSASFTFSADITIAEPQGVIIASDCSNGRYEASYTHAVGDGNPVNAPAVTGNKVVSAPVSKTSPENDYTSYTYTVSGTLTGTEA